MKMLLEIGHQLEVRIIFTTLKRLHEHKKTHVIVKQLIYSSFRPVNLKDFT